MTRIATIARTASFALIGAAFIALTPAAHADEQLPQAEMTIAGTDFTSPAAVNRLIARLHRVANAICETEVRAPFTTDDQRTCIATAMKSGMAQIEAHRQLALREAATRLAAATPAQ